MPGKFIQSSVVRALPFGSRTKWSSGSIRGFKQGTLNYGYRILQIILVKIQIDDKAADPIHQRGAIYDFAPPNKIDSKPPEQW